MVKRAYEAAPNDAYYIGHFGDVLINRLGDLHQAKAVWERAVAEAPDNAVALAQLGRVEHYLGHYARAVSLLETAFRLDPASSMTRWLLGYALLDAGRPDDAVRLFQDWVAKAPGNPTAHTNLGVVYGRARRGREAIAELEKAYQLGERSSTSTSTSASSTSTRPPISSARSSASASSSGGSPGGPGRSSCCPRSRRTSGSPRRASDEGRLARRLPQARARERPRLLGALGPDDLPRAEPTALRIST
jgi:Flp pilus assembly protein TadD